MTNVDPKDSNIQERVFAFLTDPVKHPSVRRIDTHAASVFLEGSRALKIKRAVRFPFLDYSTLEKRKAACDDEIRVNKPFAPEIYHRVIPITQSEDEQFSIGGSGKVVEYAIEMSRFDENQTLDHLAEAGPLDAWLVTAVAEAIAASHDRAPRVAAEPWIASIPGLIMGNSSALKASNCFSMAEIDDLDQASRSAFSRVRGLLEQRGRQGFVRRCHGDLHLANIVLLGRKPVLFDAIEFDEKIASTDVLYDLAFPLMDLLRYDRPDAANGLLNQYLAIAPSENFGAVAAVPLLMSIRAAIRAHVLLARRERAGEAAQEIASAARRYFNLARRLIHPPSPVLLAIGGLSGTGKSVLARALAPSIAPLPGAVIVRSDVLRKQLFGLHDTDRLPAAAYQPEVGDRVYQMMMDRAVQILSQGYSVIIDAIYARETERHAICEAAHKLHVPFKGVFLVADLATRQRRVAGRKGDASDATPEIAALQEDYEIGAMDWSIIDASGTPDSVLQQLRAAVAEVTREPGPGA